MAPTPADKRATLLSTAAGRRLVKAARRQVIVRCDRCDATGTGTVNGFGKLTSVNLPAKLDPYSKKWHHTGATEVDPATGVRKPGITVPAKQSGVHQPPSAKQGSARPKVQPFCNGRLLPFDSTSRLG